MFSVSGPQTQVAEGGFTPLKTLPHSALPRKKIENVQKQKLEQQLGKGCDGLADYRKTDRGWAGATDVTATCLWARQVRAAERVSSVIQRTRQDVN